MNKYGIFASNEIRSKAIAGKVSFNKVMSDIYADKIAQAKADHPELANATAVELALFDSGLSLASRVKDFYHTNGNEALFPAVLESIIISATDNQKFLNMLVAGTKTVDSKDVRTLKLDYNKADSKNALKYKDVGEGAELPEVTIKENSNLIHIYKRGIKVVSTYEAIQDATVNQFRETLTQAIRNNAYTQMGDVVTTLVNGDGNNNAAGVLGSFATAGKITTEELFNAFIDYYDATGLSVDTIVCGKAEAKIIAGLFTDLDKINGYRADKSFKFPQFNFNDINVIYDSRVPQVGGKNVVVMYSRADGVNKYTVANSILNEFDTNIGNQTQIGTLSERCGYGIINDNAVKVMKMA